MLCIVHIAASVVTMSTFTLVSVNCVYKVHVTQCVKIFRIVRFKGPVDQRVRAKANCE